MAQGQPYAAYQKTNVQTSNQKQLIVMLYDGMNRFMSQAINAIEKEDHETAHINLQKTSKILLELMSTLREDKGGDVAQNLKKIYVYCYEQLVIANLKKDPQMITNIMGVLNNLKQGWKEVYRSSANPKNNHQANAGIRITG